MRKGIVYLGKMRNDVFKAYMNFIIGKDYQINFGSYF